MSSDEETIKKGLIALPDLKESTKDNPLAETIDYAKEHGFSVVRLDKWGQMSDLEGKTLEEMHHLVEKAFTALKDNDCNYIGVIGKGFGGQLALTYPKNNSFEFMVLWAPTVELGDDSIDYWRSKNLIELEKLKEISIGLERVSNIDSRVEIIHGTNDEEIGLENSQRIVENLPGAKLKEIPDGDHSLNSRKAVSATEGMLLFTDM